MLQKCQVMNGDDLTHAPAEWGQHKIRTVIDISWTTEYCCRYGHTPAIPENIKITIRDENAPPPHVFTCRERSFGRHTPTAQQCEVVTGILGKQRLYEIT